MTENKVNSKVLFHATKWSALTNILRKLITPITSMVLARILTPDVFGIVATISIVISFADIFTDAGFQKYVVQHEFKDEKKLDNVSNVAFWTNLMLSMFIWTIIFVFKDKIAILVGSEGYGIHLAIAALSIPIYSFSSIQESLFKRSFNFKAMFIPRIVNSLIPLIVTIPLAIIFKNCWALIIGSLASALSDAILLTIRSKWRPRFYYNFQELKEMFSFTIWTMCEQVSIWGTLNIDVFILGTLLSSYYLGLYKTSISTVNHLFTIITTTVLPVFFSALSRCQNDNEKFKKIFYSFQNKVAIILFPMSIGLLLYGDVVTWIMLGEKWMEASIAVGVIGSVQVIRIIFSTFASEVYRSKGEPIVSFFVQIAYMMFIIVAVLWGANKGFTVLCYAKAGSIVAFAVLQLLVLQLRYKFNLLEIFKNVYQPIIASLIMALFAIIFRSFFESLIIRLYSIPICVIVYFAFCMVLPGTRNSIKSIVKNRKKGFVNVEDD